MTKLTCLVVALAMTCGAADGPKFTPDGLLKRPMDYREWIFLSSGLGMTYDPVSSSDMHMDNPQFDNVFVNRDAYRAFLTSKHWPDETIFVLELRASESKSSINQGGHFQSRQIGMEVHVRDEKRFAGKWAFFEFAEGAATAKQIPTSASCYSCHEKHGAVDTTFVQFYPTLKALP